jgi:hypothetical protein
MSMMLSRSSFAALAASLILSVATAQADWTSEKVQYDASGRLFYPADGQDNRIPDYSHAGYKGGGVPLPVVPVVLTLAPVPGDDTASIQAAIDQVAALPVQADGYRGTILLTPGIYEVSGTIRIHTSGIVLSGVGDGADPNASTILQRSGTSQASIIVAGGGTDDDFRSEVAGTRRQITTVRVPVGARTFTVDDPSPFAVGDPVIILHPSTAAWIAAMHEGGVTDTNVWHPGEIDIRYHRYVTAISGNTIAVDAPVFNHLERALSQSHVYKYDDAGIRRNIGIEKLRVDILTEGPTSETHAETAIRFVGAEDSWIRDATTQHFWHSGVQFSASTRCTVERVRAIEPHSIITGSRRYNFSTYHAQLILFRDSFASEARHAFVTNGTSTDSGIVALHSTVTRSYTFAEAHRRWSTGLLFDNLVSFDHVSSDIFGFYNRGNYGTGHGWATGHSVIWGCDVGSGRVLVQQPPTAQNYAIGCSGNVTGSGPFAGPPGFQEGTNVPGLRPQSLYLEQVAQRLDNTTPPDLTAPTAPTLTLTGTSATTVSLSWTPATDDVGVDGYDVFANGIFAGYTTGATFTVASLSPGTAYAFTVHTRDAAGNLSIPSNAVTFTTPGDTGTIRPPINFEAEDLVFTTLGANATIATETFASGGTFPSNFKYVSFAADGAPPPPEGESIEFVLPNVPAGVYTFVLRYKSHQTNRGILQLSVDGQPLGGPLNQHLAPAAFREIALGTVRFATVGDHTVRLALLGRDATALTYTLTADVFTLRPDNTAPVISAPGALTVEATGPDGAVVTYSGSAVDNLDGPVPVTFDPPSGTLFGLGATTVVATAQDAMGNAARVSFTVTVVDTTPPALALPGDLVVEASGQSGAVVTFAAGAHDLVSRDVDVSLSHQSGSIFPLGVTVVTATAQDDFDNVATGAFTVTVVDTTAPVITVPSAVTVEATGPGGASATFSGLAVDTVSGSLPVIFSPMSGSVFPLGTTTVTATATDAAGNAATASFGVAVVDTTPPVLALPANLTIETNNAAGAVSTFAATAVDSVSGSVAVTLAPPSGSLFALGTTTVTASASDAAGNRATGSFTVTVRVAAWSQAGVSYSIGHLVLHQGTTWKCIQAHRSQSDWAPPRTPALWVKVPSSNQWDFPVEYALGSHVVYNGRGYQCLQAHTSQAGWTPAATPPLWTRLSN